MKNKRGVSTVVATVLIVMLSVVAVVVVAGFIVPFVRNQLNEGTECVDYENYFYFEDEFGLNCYTTQNDNRIYAFSVGAKGEGDELQEGVKGFRVSFVKQGDAKSVLIEGGASSTEEIMMAVGGGTLELPGIGEVRSYNYTTTKDEYFSSLEIYPVLKNDRTCDRSDRISVAGEICG